MGRKPKTEMDNLALTFEELNVRIQRLNVEMRHMLDRLDPGRVHHGDGEMYVIEEEPF
jgi:hypothetical protein